MRPDPAVLAAIAAARKALEGAAALLAAVETATGAANDGGADAWVDPVRYLAAALPKRRVQQALRAGEIPGATKRGRTWLARARDVDAWLSSQSNSAPESSDRLARWRAAAAGGAP